MSWFAFSGFVDHIDKELAVQMDWFDKMNIKYIEPRGVNGKNISEFSLDEAKDIKKQLDARV